MGNFREIASLSVNTLNGFLLPVTDVSSYKWISLHTGVSVFNGTISFFGGNDPLNVTVPIELFQSSNLSNATLSIAGNTNSIWHGPIAYRFLAMQCTSYTSGTQTGIIELYETPAWWFQSVVQIAGGSSSIGLVGIQNLNTAGTLETLHDNWDNQIAFASGTLNVGTNDIGPFTNPNFKGIFVWLNITSVGAAGTAQLQLVGVDPVTDAEIILLSDAFAITAIGAYGFILYPGATPIVSTSGTAPGTTAIRTAVSEILPRTWEANVIVAGNAITASVTYAYEV